MQFTGDIDDVCPISFTPVKEIVHPVGFDSNHAFECDNAVEWITQHRACNPITTLPVEGRVVDVLHPLIVDGDDTHVPETRIKLSQAGSVMFQRSARIRQSVRVTSVNVLLFSIAVYVLGISYVLFLVAAMSFVHMAYYTCKTYPRDGKDFLAGLFSIAMDVYVIVGLVKPELDLMTRIVFAQGFVLCFRLLVDIRQLML